METIQFNQGTLPLPATLQQKYDLKSGDKFHIIDLNGAFVIMPITPTVVELARDIEQMRIEAGYSMEEMLLSLREERENYYAERHNGNGTAE